MLSDKAEDCLTNLRFADDVLLFSTSLETLREMLCEFKTGTEAVGLGIHPDKTKILSNQDKIKTKEIEVDNIKIEILGKGDSARYLGQKITFEEQETDGVNNSLKAAWAAFHKYRQELTSKDYRICQKFRLLKMVITPTMTYASGTWTLTHKHEKMIKTTQRKMLRLIVQTKRIQMEKGYNEQKTRASEKRVKKTVSAKVRMMKGEQLNKLISGCFDRGKQSFEMQLQDGPSTNKHEWATAVYEYGREKYRDAENDEAAQQERLIRLQLLAQREIEAGWQPPVVKFHDFLNALASAKNFKQPGSDGVVAEMILALSWTSLLWLYLLFLVRLEGWETEKPEAWSEVILSAIPKKTDKVGLQFAVCSPKILHSCFTDCRKA